MALIGQIRKNSWILIVMIGLGLGGFIIMDMFNSQGGILSGNQNAMGEIDGQEIDYQRFSTAEQLLYGGSNAEVFGRRDFLWNYFVEESLVKEEAEELGLNVSKQELIDLQFGQNKSPIITTRMQQGSYTEESLQQIKSLIESGNIQKAIEEGQLSPSFKNFWRYQETEIIKDRLQSKLGALVSKAIYTPNWMLEMNHAEQNNKVDFAYVRVPFDQINDMDVELSDGDYQNFINENKSDYISDEETRRISYVTFNVIPTAADSALVFKELSAQVADFRDAENDSIFVEINSGTYDPTYIKKSAINPDIADTLFNAPVGTVIGPYLEGGNYKLAKVGDRKVIPDSVRARHILLRANTQQEFLTALQTLDSLQNLIETGAASFEELAAQFGTDGTASEGGDLGYAAMGKMVKPFNDLIFYQAEEGELNTIVTQFGLHLVEVTGKKFITNEEGAKVSYLSSAIIPSESTQQAMNAKALEFVAQNRTLEQLTEAAATNPDITLQSTDALTKNGFLVGDLGAGDESRRIVRWAYSSDAEPGRVSPEVYVYNDPVNYFESKFVIAGLKSVQEAGEVDLASVKEDIEALVRNRKKGAMIVADIDNKDLNNIASKFGSQVDTVRQAAFISPRVGGLGEEPEVLATAFSLEQNAVSDPIIGNSGVFVVKPLIRSEIPVPSNTAQLRGVQTSSRRGQVAVRLMDAIKKEADITDNRSRFY